MSFTKFLHFPVSNFSKKEIIEHFVNQAQKEQVVFVTVMNANKMYLYDHNPACQKSVNESYLVLPENAINIGMKFLKRPLKEWDVGGVEIAKEILSSTTLKTFLLGAKQDILDLIINQSEYSKNIVGVHHGFFTEGDIDLIVSKINESKASIIMLGLGSPKQEILMQSLKQKLNKGILLGVGGTFDVLAGKKKDAPKWTKRGFEWLYRALQDPKKFKRYFIVNSYFVFCMVKFLITKK